MRINTNVSAMNTYGRLTNANASKSGSLAKLSSGLRINKAGDDAAGLSISEKMKSQIGGLKQATRNAQDGISLIQTAEGALNETHAILGRMRDLATQGANGTLSNDDREALNKEFGELSDEITRIAKTTEFNTKTLLDKDQGFTFQIGANANQRMEVKVGNMDAKTLGVDELKLADVSDKDDNPSTTMENLNNAKTDLEDAKAAYEQGQIDFKDAKELFEPSKTAFKDSERNLGKLKEKLDAATESVALAQKASDDYQPILTAAGGLVTSTGTTLSTTQGNVDNFLKGTTTSTITIDSLATKHSFTFDKTMDVDKLVSELQSAKASVAGHADELTDTAAIDEMITQLSDPANKGTIDAHRNAQEANAAAISANTDAVAKNAALTQGIADARLAETNATAAHTTATNDHGTLTGSYNADKLVFDAAATTFGGLEESLAKATEKLSAAEVEHDKAGRGSADAAITKIDDAIAQVSAQRSDLGAAQNRLNHTIKNLTTTQENLTEANSRIRDVDMAEEMMEFTKNNILSQAATSMLSQANAMPNSVLGLLQG